MPYIIAAVIIILIILLLSLRVRVQIAASNSFAVTLRILFFRYRIFPQKITPKKILAEQKAEDKEKAKARKAKAKTKSEKQDKPATSGKKKKISAKQKAKDIMKWLRLAIFMLKRLYARFPSYFRVKVKKAIIIIGGPDAATTAIRYGAARSALAALLTLCETCFTFKTPRSSTLLIEPDFTDEASYCDIDIELSMSICSAIRLLLRAIPAFFAGRKAEKVRQAKKISERTTPVSQI